MLANSSSGYNDFVNTPAFSNAFAKNPFRQWTSDELIAIAMTKPPLFPPGTSWAFSDTNATILGQILQRVGGKPLGALYRENLFSRLGMNQTRANPNAIVPAPVCSMATRARAASMRIRRTGRGPGSPAPPT
jgi:D-alanyl-D-alanine carboxypeptidase